MGPEEASKELRRISSSLEENPERKTALSALRSIVANLEGDGPWAIISPNDSTATIFQSEQEAEAAAASIPGGILVETGGPIVSHMEANGNMTIEPTDRIPSNEEEAAELAKGYAETVWFDLSNVSPGDVVEAAITTAD